MGAMSRLNSLGRKAIPDKSWIRRRVYGLRDDEARQNVFDYIEMFYNAKRKHVRNGMPSPVEFEHLQKT